MKRTGIVVFGAVFVDVKGYPLAQFIPGGRNVGRVVQVHGGVSRNVVEDIANVELRPTFVSVVDETGMSLDVLAKLKRHKVNTDYIRTAPDGLGTWLAVFDNTGDVVAAISKRPDLAKITETLEEYGDEIFEGAEWFHFTGITPAVSDNLAAITLEAVKKAKEHGLTVSCDLNYRGKLWSKEKAGKVMAELCQYVDVCIANEEDADDVFGIKASSTDVTTGKLNREGYIEVAQKLTERFGFKKVAITLRESISANDNNWSAMLYTDGEAYFSKKYALHIVDRVGGGDSFGGGLIYSCVNGFGPQETIEFAVAASALKHSIEGDFNLVTVDEVKKLAGGDGSGRIQR